MAIPQLLTNLTPAALQQAGLGPDRAACLSAWLGGLASDLSSQQVWQQATKVLTPNDPFEVHNLFYRSVYATELAAGQPAPGQPAPIWLPDEATVRESRITSLMRHAGVGSYAGLHEWSVRRPEDFWRVVLDRADVRFRTFPKRILGEATGPGRPEWLVGARFNIIDTLLQVDPTSVAFIYQDETCGRKEITYGELSELSSRVADGLQKRGLQPGDRVALYLPRNLAGVVSYLGILRAGMVAVMMAETLAPPELKTRLEMTRPKLVITQDEMGTSGKSFGLYEKLTRVSNVPAVVFPRGGRGPLLRSGDHGWEQFLGDEEGVEPVALRTHDPLTVLFSSGTTARPKAVVWDGATAIKAGIDGWFQDIGPSDRVMSSSSGLGWMVGPKYILMALMNRAAMAVYGGNPKGKGFVKFVQEAGVTLLGLVPALVRDWRETGVLNGADWSAIRSFANTGECSYDPDVRWLASQVMGYAPVLETCGGTELGGAYVSGVMTEPNVPCAGVPTLGVDVCILDEKGREAEQGEVFLGADSLGLSRQLVGRDHDEVYLDGAPLGPRGQVLRIHGDAARRRPGEIIQVDGRVDDVKNINGIKVSLAAVDAVVAGMGEVAKAASLTVERDGERRERLVVVVSPKPGLASQSDADWLALVKKRIKDHMDPLIEVSEVCVLAEFPAAFYTGTNKLVRKAVIAWYRALTDSAVA